MKIKDFIWFLILLSISLFIFLPITNPIFTRLTTTYPYLMGFIKTMILASMGEMLVKRIQSGYYTKDPGLYIKAIVWGLLGMVFVFVFPLFDGGIRTITNQTLLSQNPFLNTLGYALIISTTMNVIFAPTFMIIHRITDTYINLGKGSLKRVFTTPFDDVLNHIDFKFFYKFVVLKTIPLFWIPAHTITFILPSTYRVLMASYLSIALGILMSIKKK